MKLPDNSDQTVLVLGDAMVDAYISVDISRISQEAPVPVALATSNARLLPGGAANVAVNIRALGARAALYAAVGQDEMAYHLAQAIAAAGVNAALAQVQGLPTTCKTRYMAGRDHKQQVFRLDLERVVDSDVSASYIRAFCAGVEGRTREQNAATVVVLSDYAKGVLADPQPAIRACHRAGVPVLVDPKRDDWSVYSGATLIKPNESEFLSAMGLRSMDAVEWSRVREALRAMRVGSLVITQGAAGATIVQADDEAITRVRAHPVAVADTTGAGDTTLATMAAWFGLMPLADLVKLAMRASSIACARTGTAIVTRTDLEAEHAVA